jgi:hypothetical protein
VIRTGSGHPHRALETQVLLPASTCQGSTMRNQIRFVGELANYEQSILNLLKPNNQPNWKRILQTRISFCLCLHHIFPLVFSIS